MNLKVESLQIVNNYGLGYMGFSTKLVLSDRGEEKTLEEIYLSIFDKECLSLIVDIRNFNQDLESLSWLLGRCVLNKMIVTIETYLTVVCKFINNPNTIIPYHRIIALMSAEASVNDMNHIVEMAKLLDKNDILILSMSNKVKHPQNMIYNIYNNIKSQLYVVESDSITETLLIESKLFDIRLLNRIP